MKLKNSAIALAVAGVVATPMAAQADIYASARIGVENVDTGGVSDLRMRSFGSRFGVRSETDLGNGMTGFGRFEWDVDFADHNEDDSKIDPTDTDADGNISTEDGSDIDLRHRYVGIKGDFGSLTIGQTSHTWYNFAVAPTDNPWWGSGYNMVRYSIRTDSAVSYAGGTGDINFGATVYFEREDDEDAPDAIEIGASFPIGDMTLGGAIRTTETTHGSEGTDDNLLGIVISGIQAGPVSMGFGVQAQDEDTSLVADFGFGNAYLHIETLSDDSADADPMLINIGYTQSLGRKTTAWYELVSNDADTGDSDDDTTVLRAVLKYDIE